MILAAAQKMEVIFHKRYNSVLLVNSNQFVFLHIMYVLGKMVNRETC